MGRAGGSAAARAQQPPAFGRLSAQAQSAAGLRPQSRADGGPTGADGRRPVLAWPTPPAATTSRTYSQAVAARTADATVGPPGRSGAAEGSSSGGRQPPQLDEHGFETVTRKTRWNGKGGGAEEDIKTEGAAAGQQVSVDQGPMPRAASAMDETAAGPIDDEGVPMDADEAAEADELPDPAVLRANWDREKELLDLLQRQGREADDPLRLDVEQRCEEARAAWEGTRRPQPLHRMLRKAEVAAQKARKRMATLEQQIHDLDPEYERRRRELEGSLHESRAQKTAKEGELETILRQMGDRGGGAHEEPPIERIAMEEVAKRIEGVAPSLQAALELVPTGTDEHASLAQAIAVLAGACGEAAEVARVRVGSAQQYRIGGGAWSDDEGAEQYWERGASSWHYGEPAHGWGGHACGDGHGDGGGQWSAGSAWADAFDGGHDGWGSGAGSGGAGTSAAMQPTIPLPATPVDILAGRGEVFTGGVGVTFASEEDRIRAQEAYALQTAAQSATSQTGFATPNASAAAAEVHHVRLAHVKAEATNANIPFDSQYLDSLDLAGLARWEKEHVGG